MELPKLPTFPDVRDIQLYFYFDSDEGPDLTKIDLRGSSLEGQRSIADFFEILGYHIGFRNGDFTLRRLDPNQLTTVGPPIERSSSGNIIAGDYVVEPTIEGEVIMFYLIPTFSSYHQSPTFKRVKLEGESTGSKGSEKSIRDHTTDNQGFKMRLVQRDQGCAACLAAGGHDIYKYCNDSNRFEGAHIVGIAFWDVWDAKKFKSVVKDPFTDPANAKSQNASSSTRSGNDPRRINSLENGLLLCVQHHGDYDSFRFAINPDTHKIFSFYHATADLHGIEVTAPWLRDNVLFPPPHRALLKMHFQTSIWKAMKASGDDCELDDDDEDYEELSELEEVEVQNEQVKTWLDGLSGMESLDFTAEKKGNIEMLADMRGVQVVSV